MLGLSVLPLCQNPSVPSGVNSTFPERPPLLWATPDTRWRQGSAPISLQTFCLA